MEEAMASEERTYFQPLLVSTQALVAYRVHILVYKVIRGRDQHVQQERPRAERVPEDAQLGDQELAAHEGQKLPARTEAVMVCHAPNLS